MKLRLLGAAAGGGFPQWNCSCPQCDGVRRGTIRATRRTQASLAVSSDGESWLLCGASPDVRAQLDTPTLWPRDGSPVRGVALPNGDVDAWAGLLTLREWAPLELFATSRVREDLVERNAVLGTLRRFDGQSSWHELDHERQRFGALTIEALPAPGAAPLHLRGERDAEPLDNVALVLRDDHSSVVWAPTVRAPTEALAHAIDEASVVFFDGTFWTDDELVRTGRSARRARDMGHWPLSGDDGSLRWLAERGANTKALVHINNTNPVLVDDGAERATVRRLGIDVGVDGWEHAT
jgi:pyrroloquinoline quinone biosynthesis protein B